MTKKQLRTLGAVSIVLIFALILGLGGRSRICVSCDVQGPFDVTWYGIRLVSFPDKDWLFDEFGSAALWEQIYGQPCNHNWHFRTGILFVIPREHGSPLALHFGRGRGPVGLRALAKENQEWARLAWQALRTLPEERRGDALCRLEELGGEVLTAEYAGREIAPDRVVYWWNKNQDWITAAPPQDRAK